MTATLPRKEFDDIPPTMFLRPRRPDDHKEFKTLLPWMTPLFTYQMEGETWVRWAIPQTVGERMGLTGGCACCGDDETLETDNDFQVDTAWSETGWWLTENGYARSTPTKGKKS